MLKNIVEGNWITFLKGEGSHTERLGTTDISNCEEIQQK